MTISPGAQALLDAIETTATSRPVAEAVIRKTTVDQVAKTALTEAAAAQTKLADPGLIAQYDIDLAQQAILGRLQGLLPNENLATIEDATKLGTGVVLAQAMAVQDAAAINLWVQNAAIQSAKISGLVADKILAGILQASVSIASGGSITWPGGNLTPLGVTLTDTASDAASAATSPASKITPPGSWAAYNFYTVPGERRGGAIRSDGNAGNMRANNRIDSAGDGVFGSARHAFLVVQGGRDETSAETFVRVSPHLGVVGNMSVSGSSSLASLVVEGASQFAGGLARIDGAGNVIGQAFVPQFSSLAFGLNTGSTRSEAHGLGTVPRFVAIQRQITGGWVDASYETTMAMSMTTTHINVQNNTGAQQVYRVFAYA